MARYIDLDDAEIVYCHEDGEYETYNIPIDFPAADVRENVHGHWIGSYCPYTCDQCGKTSDSRTPFCRYCGADMREEK